MSTLAIQQPTNQNAAGRSMWPLATASMVICAIVTAVMSLRSFADQLWSDEILTTILLQADTLSKLWSGIALGIDGNPPLYLTAMWLIVKAAPASMVSAAALKSINLCVTIAAFVTLCQFGRRFVSLSTCLVACALFVTLNNSVIFVAFELRAYASYFLMAALAVLLQQRLVERGRAPDAIMLALAFAGLAMAHTFGIAYVFCIALSGWASSLGGEKSRLRLTLASIVPAVVAVGLWTPSLLEQLEVAKPYGWIERPGLPELLDTLFASKAAMLVALLELLFGLGAMLKLNRREAVLAFRELMFDQRRQQTRYLALVLIGFTGFALVGWAVSIAFYPLFVPRYFTPQMIVALALHVAVVELLLRQGAKRTAMMAICVIVAPLMFLNVQLNAAHRKPVCSDARGGFFETSYLNGDLPVIAESPHVFLPRLTYSERSAAYRYPLDWDVVLKYPSRARGNAVDFHIMQNIQAWKPMPSVMSTEEILRSFPQFLVIEQPGRSWFHNLMATRKVTADRLATTGDDQSSCTLWKVTGVQSGP